MDKDRKTLSPTRRTRRKAHPAPIPNDARIPMVVPEALEAPGYSEVRNVSGITADLPLLFCAVNQAYLELGLAVVVVARRLGRSAVVAHFAVDLLARGVVECYADAVPREDLVDYLDNVDGNVGLEACALELASALVWGGAHHGTANGVEQALELDLWGRLLARPTDPGPADALAFHGRPRPLAVAEVLPLGRRGDEAPLDLEPRLIVRRASLREH